MSYSKPVVSFVIFSFNQQDFIEDTIDGAFSQTYSPLEIIISDDCSTDENLIRIQKKVDSYDGVHKVIVNKTPKNLGLSAHIDSVVRMAEGNLVVMCAGDDIALPSRTQKIYDEWRHSSGKVKAFFSNVQIIDRDNNLNKIMFNDIPNYSRTLNDFLKPAKVTIGQPKCWLLGCSECIDKEIVTRFDRINPKVIQEDAVIAFRAILLGELKYVDDVLLLYRRHGNNVFQPDKLSNTLYLLKREYFYKKQWLVDAQKVCLDNKSLINVLKNEVRIAFVFHVLLQIPGLGYLFLSAKRIIKFLIGYKTK